MPEIKQNPFRHPRLLRFFDAPGLRPQIAEMVPSLVEWMQTHFDAEASLTSQYGRADETREAWDSIEEQLIEWGCSPSELYDEGTESPSGETIRLAIQLAMVLGQQGLPAPTRVVPDAHGGIVFERQGRNEFESIHVQPDGKIEHRVFEKHRLVLRESLILSTAEHE